MSYQRKYLNVHERSPALNHCLDKAYFPACWKVAKIFYAPNFLDLTKVHSYSLLPAWGKLLHKILTTRLDYFLEWNNLYHPLQFGFRKNKSTSLVMHSVLHFVNKGRQENKATLMLVLDNKGRF